ncbi:hypothetical protein [Parvularcula maris]|uniref:Uncharacterized protein n=1 Tax=Parvularcula maris TaxID=2965077 RepID=A0A9X2L9E6_9PROT|nr:hypothetical protein [Parvularcula maris]MCQ8185472.1 hypothetical protein [Parvularcula maris]
MESGSEQAPAGLVAEASLALGRLSSAAERSPLYPLWISHETGITVAHLFSRGAAPIEPWELMALAAGLPGARPSLEENAARRFWARARRLWSVRVTDRPLASVPEITNELFRLSREGMPPGDLALEAPLRLARSTCIPLPCCAAAMPSPEEEAWSIVILEGLKDAAERSYDRLLQLEWDFARWQAALPDARGDSRLGDVLVLLGTTYSLSPRFVAETLKITRQAAARLLRRLEEAGVVQQMAQRQRWLVYLATNLGAPSVRESTTATTAQIRPTVDTASLDRVLEQAYAALDRNIRREGTS